MLFICHLYLIKKKLHFERNGTKKTQSSESRARIQYKKLLNYVEVMFKMSSV